MPGTQTRRYCWIQGDCFGYALWKSRENRVTPGIMLEGQRGKVYSQPTNFEAREWKHFPGFAMSIDPCTKTLYGARMDIDLRKDRAIGAFIGLAVGDAVGTTVEFKEPGEFEPLTDMIGGGCFRLNAGEWTDDTSMALCLADVILEHNTVDPYQLLIKFARWYHIGENSSNGKCFDIGTTCVGAIREFEKAKAYVPAPDHHFLSGNGSIMRLAPVAVRWSFDRDTAISMGDLQGLTTHGSKACRRGCEVLTAALIDLINEKKPSFSAYKPDGKKFKSLNPAFVPNTGFVDHTMLAAIWAYKTTDNFRDCILAAANLGGDADTIAAVAGQIAGAKYGLSGIPEEWVAKLAQKDHLLDLATRMYEAGRD